MNELIQEELQSTPVTQIDANDSTLHTACYTRCEVDKNMILEASELPNVGRFLTLQATVKNICPNRRVALGIKLYETTGGSRVLKGYKTYSFKHNESNCRDVSLCNIRFVLPEELSEGDDNTTMCGQRSFDIETNSHYVNIYEG